MPQDISFGISGENAAFMRALKESQDAVSDAAARMHSSFEGVSAVFGRITGALGLFSAALAGGAAFKDAINTTVELAVGAEDLGRQFGISATQASVLRVALDDAHVSTETFHAAGNAMTRQLNTNEEAFKSMGIATRGSGGELRNQLDIMLDAIDHLAKLKEGADRNIEGQRLFGRAWGEMGRIVNVTSEAMREAAEKADQLGLSVGGEQLAATNRYRAAMNDVNDVMTGLKNVIGQAVMPILTDMGEWFGSIGPGLVETFRVALATLAVPFRVITLGLEVIYETGKAVFTQLAEYATTFGQTFNKALHGDFAGAAQAWREGMGRIEQIGHEYWERIVAEAQQTQERIVNSFVTAIVGPKSTPLASGGGGSAGESDAESKKAMDILRERIRLEDQHLDLRLKQKEYELEERYRVLSGEEQKEAAEQRSLDQLKEKIRLNDQAAASRLKSIDVDLEESDRFLRGQQRAQQMFQQRWGSVFSAVGSAFSSSISGMLAGTTTFAGAMRNIFSSLVDALIQSFVQMGVQWLAEMIFQKIVQKSTAAAGISANAGLAASAAMASVAAIPFVGWAMAPAVGATTFAEAMAYQASTAAAGGFDVPTGVNPVTQLHQREMVLPANIADPRRESLGAGSGRSRGQGPTVNFRDAGGGYGLVHMGNLADAIKKLGGQFKLS